MQIAHSCYLSPTNCFFAGRQFAKANNFDRTSTDIVRFAHTLGGFLSPNLTPKSSHTPIPTIVVNNPGDWVYEISEFTTMPALQEDVAFCIGLYVLLSKMGEHTGNPRNNDMRKVDGIKGTRYIDEAKAFSAGFLCSDADHAKIFSDLSNYGEATAKTHYSLNAHRSSSLVELTIRILKQEHDSLPL
jgi:hypothetical protein